MPDTTTIKPTPEADAECQQILEDIHDSCEAIRMTLQQLQNHPGKDAGPLRANPRWLTGQVEPPVLDPRNQWPSEPAAIAARAVANVEGGGDN